MSYDVANDIFYVMGALQQERSLANDIPNDDKDDLAYLAGERIVEANGLDYYNDPESAAMDEANEFYPGGSMTLWAIPRHSVLYTALEKWYGSHDAMMGNIRGAFERDEYLYFCSGCGYDIISADLLGGSADGEASKQFDDMLAHCQFA